MMFLCLELHPQLVLKNTYRLLEIGVEALVMFIYHSSAHLQLMTHVFFKEVDI